MRKLPVRKSEPAVIDDVDRDLAARRWYVKKKGYVYAANSRRVGGGKVYLQRVIMARKLGRPLSPKERVDHRDRNLLNNRRDNLRLATSAQNATNSKDRKRKHSKYRGVSFHRLSGLWMVRIRVHPKVVLVGCFKDEREGAESYDAAALKHHGEFATTNRSLGLLSVTQPAKRR